MVASPATLSPVGVVLTTCNGVGGAVVVADADVLWLRETRTSPAAATARARAPTRPIQKARVAVLLFPGVLR